jgi:hypothetical protein
METFGRYRFSFMAAGAQSFSKCRCISEGDLHGGGNDFSYAYKNLKLSPSQLSKSVLPNIARFVFLSFKIFKQQVQHQC